MYHVYVRTLYIYGSDAIYPQGVKVTPDNFVAGHRVICALLICYFKRTKVSSAFKTQPHNGTPLSNWAHCHALCSVSV